jgi:hypothetical protein
VLPISLIQQPRGCPTLSSFFAERWKQFSGLFGSIVVGIRGRAFVFGFLSRHVLHPEE